MVQMDSREIISRERRNLLLRSLHRVQRKTLSARTTECTMKNGEMRETFPSSERYSDVQHRNREEIRLGMTNVFRTQSIS